MQNFQGFSNNYPILGKNAHLVKQGAMRVMMWRPKRGGGGAERAADDDADAAGDASDISAELRQLLVENLTWARDDLDATDPTFATTTNIRS